MGTDLTDDLEGARYFSVSFLEGQVVQNYAFTNAVSICYVSTYTLVTGIAKEALRGQIPEAGTCVHDLSLNTNVLMFAFLVSLR